MFAAWLLWGDRFKDIFFPDSSAWNISATITQWESGWPGDVSIHFRCADDTVYLTLPRDFMWQDRSGHGERALPLERAVAFDTPFGSTITLLLSKHDVESLVFTKYRANTSRITVGRLEQNDICDMDGNVSGEHGYLELGGNRAEYTDRSSNGTYLNGRMVHNNSVLLQFGDTLILPSGLKLIYLNDIIAINHMGALKHARLPQASAPAYPRREEDSSDADDRSLYREYHRAPRILNRINVGEIEIEPPIPKQQQRQQPAWLQIGPSATMVLPMVVGTMAMNMGASGATRGLSGIAMIGTSSLLAVMWGSINRRYHKKEEAEAERQRIGLYEKYIAEMEEELKALNEAEYNRLVSNFPNVGQCALIPQELSSQQLWNRMPSHDDFLEVRLGTGAVSFPGTIETQKQKLSIIDDPLREEPERLKRVYSVIADAPYTVKLRGEKVIGILGGAEAVLFAQGLLMQLTSLHSYHDVRVAVLTDEASASEWDWARWLPHVFNNADREMRMIASNPATIHEVMNYVDDVLSMRVGEEDEEKQGQEPEISELPLPHYIIFCTNYRLLENEPIMRRLLTRQLGTTLVMIAPSMELLPKESHLIINLNAKPNLLHTSEGDTSVINFEYPNRHLLRSFAEQMAPLRVHDIVESAAIPTLVSFLDIYNVRRVEDLDIWRMWRENHTDVGLRSVIGYTSGSRPFVLDISENYHGPHGLIAGTTGSGKSVMLQTYILSLALNYSPEAVQFILIDYKGGGMADAFRTLPHVVGIIDNLQGEQVINRALASLKGELHRREILFKRTGVKDIIEYTRQFRNDPDAVKLSHLIIIADEFAELKTDQPEFMKELVSASRIGRSLGVHLILATQKPAGSVSDEIWANSRFHLCLRVQTVADSRDMLKRPDAAYIKGTGRCFIQIGNDESFDQVQTSYSGLTYDPNVPLPEEMPHLLGDVGRAVVVPRKQSHQLSEGKKKTQMTAVLERIYDVAGEHAMNHQRRMWMPEMPARVYYDTLPVFLDNRVREDRYPNPERLTFVMGLADDTANQRYLPLMVNLTEMRNLLLIGLAGSGKTTAVQSMIYSLANTYDPAHLNMYVLSLSSATLNVLSAFPHVGDVVLENDVIEIRRFINMMVKEEERRSALFAGASTDSFIEYNKHCQASGKPPVPAIVIFIDRFEQLRNMFDGDDAMTARIHALIRGGSSRGIHFVVTAMAHNELPYKLHAFFTGIALQLNDRGDYTDAIGKRVPPEQPPIARFPGRGLAVIDDNIYEIQIGLGGVKSTAPGAERFTGFDDSEPYFIDMPLAPVEALNDTQRSDAIVAFGEAQAKAWHGALPTPIPRIPEKADWKAFSADTIYSELQKTPFDLPIAYDLYAGEIMGLNLEEHFSMFITGPRKCGRTNLLMLIARTMLARGAEVHVMGDSEWKAFAKETGISLYTTPKEIADFSRFFAEERLNPRTPLKVEAKAQGKAALRKCAMSLQPIAVIFDNAQRIATDFNTQELADSLKMMRDLYGQLCAKADHYGFYFFFSAPFTAQAFFMQEPLKSLIAQGRGISLGGKVYDCNPLGIANLMPSAMARRQLASGEGYLIADGQVRQIVVPFAGAEEEP